MSYNIFYPESSNFPNSGMVGRRKLPDTSINNIFNTLSIGLQYTLLFKWPDFGHVTIPLKFQSLKFKASVLYEIFPFLKQAGIVIHFLNSLIQLLLWNKESKSAVGHVLFEPWYFFRTFLLSILSILKKTLMSDKFLLKLFVFDIFNF